MEGININTYVCVLSTDNYLDGVLILNENLKHLKSKYPLLCLINEKISDYTKNMLNCFGIKYKVINMIEYDYFSENNDYWKYTFDKLNIFTLTEYEKIVYLDSDLLILENLDHLFNESHLTMALDYPFGDNYNSGVMILKPNLDDYNRLIEYSRKCNEEGKKYSDQNIINNCCDNINPLPIKYNKMVSLSIGLNCFYDFTTEKYILKNGVLDYNQYNDNPMIIHYIGKTKPFMIKCDYYDEYVDLYKYYYSLVYRKKDRYDVIFSNHELITIIVPFYNNQSSIKRCVDSIVNQTYKNLEIILINDGSTDDGLDICKQYRQKDDRIIIINNECNKGVSYSRNVGLKNAHGKYIGFVDADDYVAPDMYEIMYYNCTKFNAQFCQCGAYLDNNSCRSLCMDDIHLINTSDILFNIIEENMISYVVWDKLFRRDLLDDIVFDESISKHEDAKFVTEFLYKCDNIIMIKDILYFYMCDCNHSLYNNISLKSNLELIKINNKIQEKTRNLLPTYEDNLYNNKYYSDIKYILMQIIVNKFSDPKKQIVEFIQFVKGFINEHTKIDQYKILEINDIIKTIETSI